MPADFSAVMWARRMAEALEALRGLEVDDLSRLVPLIEGMAALTKQGERLSDQQLRVILENMYAKTLAQVQADRGGVLVEFTGGDFEHERFLIRADGRVPNNRYEARLKRDA
jgi:hypothetical protein